MLMVSRNISNSVHTAPPEHAFETSISSFSLCEHSLFLPVLEYIRNWLMYFVTEQRNDVVIKMIHWVILQLDVLLKLYNQYAMKLLLCSSEYMCVCSDVCICVHICVHMYTQLLCVWENGRRRESCTYIEGKWFKLI